jgi:hypothetical protein
MVVTKVMVAMRGRKVGKGKRTKVGNAVDCDIP